MHENKIAIVGAGITGLTAAWALKKRGIDVDLFEQHGYAGGSIRSVREDEWLLEYGPNTLLIKDRMVADFLQDLGLWKERIIANPESSKRFIVKHGQLLDLPSSVFGAVTTPLFTSSAKLRVLKELFVKKSNQPDETVAKFVERRFGREILDYALNPFIAGIYANKPEKLSVRYTFPNMHEAEQSYGSLIWGSLAGKNGSEGTDTIKRELISFEDGVHQMVDVISNHLDDIYYSHEIVSIQKSEEQWFLKSTFGEKGPYQDVILNIPLYKWNEQLLPIKTNELEKIKNVEYPPLSVFHLGFKKDAIKHPLDGFGFLVPEKENRSILGALFSSTLFLNRAPTDSHLITVFVGGGRQPKLAVTESDRLLKIILDDLNELIGVQDKPTFKEHVFWPNSIPTYHVGYDEVLDLFDSIEVRNQGLHLAGNFRNGVSVPDCIKNGLRLAEEILD